MNDEELGALSSSTKSAHKRVDDLEKQIDDLEKKLDDIHNLAVGVARLDEEMKNIKTDVSEIKDDMKKVAARPGQWWDKLIAVAFGAIASGLVAAILGQVIVK